MRDPTRIDQVLATIRKIWFQHPDSRLGQLLVNAVRLSDASTDLFNVEDTVLIRKLALLAKRLGNNPTEDEQTLRMDVGRADGGRTFVRVVYLPSGQYRTQVGLNGEKAEVVGQRLAQELMNEVNGPEDDSSTPD